MATTCCGRHIKRVSKLKSSLISICSHGSLYKVSHYLLSWRNHSIPMQAYYPYTDGILMSRLNTFWKHIHFLHCVEKHGRNLIGEKASSTVRYEVASLSLSYIYNFRACCCSTLQVFLSQSLLQKFVYIQLNDGLWRLSN